MSDTIWLDEWDAVVATGDSAAIEETWLAKLADGLGDGSAHAEALRRLRAAGKKSLAATLLELAAEQAASDHAWAARKLFLSELIRLSIGDADRWKAGLEESVRHLWADRPSLAKLLQQFPLRSARKPLLTLETLEVWLDHDVGGVFAMAGRGPGRVVEANPQLATLRLDFEREKRVPMPIDAARKYLTPLPPGHFLRRRLEQPASLAQEVMADPQAALAAILESAGNPVAVPEIKAALAGLLPEEQWTSWWGKARKHPRLLASGSGAKVAYRLAEGDGAEGEILAEFARAALAEKVELARRHAGRGKQLFSRMGAELLRVAADGAAEPGLAWEALVLAARSGAPADGLRAAQQAVLERAGPLGLLEAAGDAQQRETVLEFVRQALPIGWIDTFTAWLEREGHPRVLSRLATALKEAGQSERVRVFLDQVFLNPTRQPAAFVWACELEGPLAPLVEDRRGGSLLVRLVELAERREFGPLRARIRELLTAGGLAGRIVQQRLSLDQARRIQQILEHPGELADERNWLRRAVAARYPELRQEAAPDVVPALAATVDRLHAELKRMLEKEIPETLKAIQIAKEHGDLSENFEYHAARARQEFLSARAANLQADLGRVQVIDPAKVDVSRVRVGTRVWLRHADSGERRALVILGPYDGDPDKGILSHGSEAAQALLDRAPGDSVNVDGRTWKIESIERAT